LEADVSIFPMYIWKCHLIKDDGQCQSFAGSDDEWLGELLPWTCQVTLPLAVNQQDESDDEWLRDICKAPASSTTDVQAPQAPLARARSLASSTTDAQAPQVPLARAQSLAIPSEPSEPAESAISTEPENRNRSLAPIRIIEDVLRFGSVAQMTRYLRARNVAIPMRPNGLPPLEDIVFSDLKDFSEHRALMPKTLLQLMAPIVTPFDYAVSRLLMWRNLIGPIIFKIGIAAEPSHRFNNLEYGYRREGIWQFMDVVLCGSARVCRQWEIDLIFALQSFAGCYNVKPGGEGVGKERTYICYLYIVVCDAGSGPLSAAVKRRRLAQTHGAIGALGAMDENIRRA
jgi:hypothetical protein